MAQFALIYVGEPQFESQAAAQAHQQQFFEWLGSLGDAVVNSGTPLGPAVRVSADGETRVDSAERLTGFSIVEAEDIDAAVAMAQRSPYLDKGRIDVAQVFQM